jgi:predicted membrane protein
MKMVSYVDGIFWGVLLIAVGAWFLFRRYVPVTIPVFRVIVAVIFVYFGIRILVRGPEVRDRNTLVFSESTMSYSPDRGGDYNVIFSTGTVDLSNVALSGGSVRTQVNVVFGNGTLRINPSMPVRVVMSSAFGTVDAPNGRSVAFGDTSYTTSSYKDGAPALDIHATAVFGRLTILP